MCRPLWAAWVGTDANAPAELKQDVRNRLWANERERILCVTRLGEGSHREIIDHLPQQAFDHFFHPFECRWPTEREARFQPQGDLFYGYDDLPSRAMFDAAQEALEREIGTWDKLRDWVLAGAKLYGEAENAASLSLSRESLLRAACSALRDLPLRGEIIPPPAWRMYVVSGKLSIHEPAPFGAEPFHRWADAFSDRKNRVPLWAN